MHSLALVSSLLAAGTAATHLQKGHAHVRPRQDSGFGGGQGNPWGGQGGWDWRGQGGGQGSNDDLEVVYTTVTDVVTVTAGRPYGGNPGGPIIPVSGGPSNVAPASSVQEAPSVQSVTRPTSPPASGPAPVNSQQPQQPEQPQQQTTYPSQTVAPSSAQAPASSNNAPQGPAAGGNAVPPGGQNYQFKTMTAPPGAPPIPSQTSSFTVDTRWSDTCQLILSDDQAPKLGGSDWVEAHNNLRALHGVPSVTIDAAMQSQADEAVKSCPTDHPTGYKGGQNLSQGRTDPAEIVYDWYNERANYSALTNNFLAEMPNIIVPCGSDDSVMLGHFSQVVWKETTGIGCATNAACGGKYGSSTLCFYNPAGNAGFTNNGQPYPECQYNVLRPSK